MVEINKQLKDDLNKEIESLLRPRDWLRAGLSAVAVVSALGCGSTIMVITGIPPLSDQAFNQANWIALGTGVISGVSGFGAYFIGKKNDRIRGLLREL